MRRNKSYFYIWCLFLVVVLFPIFLRVFSASCYKNPTIGVRGLLSALIIAHLGDKDYRIIHAIKRPNLLLEWTLQLYRAVYENEKNRKEKSGKEIARLIIRAQPIFIMQLFFSSCETPLPGTTFFLFANSERSPWWLSRSGRAIFPWELTNLGNRRS